MNEALRKLLDFCNSNNLDIVNINLISSENAFARAKDKDNSTRELQYIESYWR